MLSRIEELALIARCIAADDRRAFGRLVEEYQPQLRRFLLNMAGGDAALAADLAQDTFIKAYTGIRSYQGVAGFKTWLYRIACNEFCSYRRKRREELAPPDAGAAMEAVAPDSNAASDARMDMEHCLRRLSEPERTVVLLFYMEDQPIKKISKITGMPEGTIKSHLSRAKKKMADTMQH